MNDQQTFVIVGAGLAGATAAAKLREQGFRGRIVLIGSEQHQPYLRPPLSKDYLRGVLTRDDLRVHPRAFYADNDVELRLGFAVAELDRHNREVVLDNKDRVHYDRLLLATGVHPRTLDVPGSELSGIVTLRSIADADALRGRLASGQRLVVVGGGWIGTEVAASARQMGHDVTLIHRDPAPLQSGLGTEVGAVYLALHVQHGVDMRMSTEVISFTGVGAVEHVITSDGQSIAADLVVVGIGATPRTELAAAAGLEVDNGIVVDEFLRTDDEAVFAAGDVAAACHPMLRCRHRVEHWSNAIDHGSTAASNMLGAGIAAQELPYFFSDQYDVAMEYIGHAESADRVIFRGDRTSHELVALWMKGDEVTAGMALNTPGVIDTLRNLITERIHVPDHRLTDLDIALPEPVAALSTAAPSVRSS